MTNYLALALAIGLLYLVFRTVNRKLTEPHNINDGIDDCVEAIETLLSKSRSLNSKYFRQRRYTKAPAIH